MKETVTLGSRLAACADMCRRGSAVADIGTDHALLPIYLIQSGKAPHVFASDINPEPLARAAENIERYSASCPGLSEKITLVLGSGLEKIPPSAVSDIVIAGMGGELIADILSAAPWAADKRYRLVLQPMSKHDKLRGWLYGHGFDIREEVPVLDNDRCYSVMMCEYTGRIRLPDLIGLFCGRIAEALSADAVCAEPVCAEPICCAETRNAARRYLMMTRKRFEDMKKGADIRGDSTLSSELEKSIYMISEAINE